MEELLLFRPLLWATIEYCLALIVLKKGSYYPRTIAGILFFLGSYQLGEFVLFAGEVDYGLQFSLASTTLLPPLGLLLISKHLNRPLGYFPVQILGLVYASMFLLNPDLIVLSEKRYCLAKLAAPNHEWNNITYSWYVYYVGTLTYSMAILAWAYFHMKFADRKQVTMWMFVGYSTFFPASYFLITLVGESMGWVASFMCALAITVAFIITWIGTSFKPSIE